MRVVITNAVLANSGDAAICLGIVAALAERGIAQPDEIVVLDNNAAVTAPAYPDLTVVQQPLLHMRGGIVRRLLRMLGQLAVLACVVPLRLGAGAGRLAPSAARHYAQAELIVSTGGTYLVEHYRIWPRLVELLVVSLGRAPLVLWTQSLGPFERRSSRVLMRHLLRRTALVMLRDERSREHLLALDARRSAKVVVAPDAAFALARAHVPDPVERDVAAVISVREWDTAVDGRTRIDIAPYEQAMRIAATRLASSAPGARVIGLSTCQGIPSYGIDDSAYASRLFAALPGVEVDSQFHRPEELMRVLRRTKVVVATRLHLAILGLLCGCQVAAVAYEFKTIELFRAHGLEQYVILLADCTPDAVLQALDRMAADAGAASLLPDELLRLADEAVPMRALREAILGPSAIAEWAE